MALKSTTIRFETRTLEFAAREAAARGETLAEYIRAATITRAVVDWRRRNPNGADRLSDVVELVDAYLKTETAFDPINET